MLSYRHPGGTRAPFWGALELSKASLALLLRSLEGIPEVSWARECLSGAFWEDFGTNVGNIVRLWDRYAILVPILERRPL